MTKMFTLFVDHVIFTE